jgi:hypothetical protein
MRKLILLLVLLTGLRFASNAQSDGCLRDFDFLVQRIKADYPGYDVKVTPETSQSLQNLEDKLRKKIVQYPDSCEEYFSQFIDWFKDGHLYIKPLSNPNSSSNRNKDNRKYCIVSDSILKVLKSKKTTPEGIWYSFNGDIAIIKLPDSVSYLGISLSYADFNKYQIFCKLLKTKEGKYHLITYSPSDGRVFEKGSASMNLNDRVLEGNDINRFVRKTDSQIFDLALISSYLPEYPNGVNYFPVAFPLSDSTFFLRITSFMNNQAEILTKKHWTEITTRPNLIIDIRDNSGGQDYFQALEDLLYTHPFESKGVEYYATEDNIKMYEETLKDSDFQNGEFGKHWIESLLEEMKKNKGEFIIPPIVGQDVIVKHDTIYEYPHRIGIIINEMNASSAEEFLLIAKQSSKAILFGDCNTAGILDYSNAVPVNFPSNKYELNMPMTRSRRLPQNPIDNIGIPPDVIIPYPATMQLYDRLDQWDYFVKEYLENMNSIK